MRPVIGILAARAKGAKRCHVNDDYVRAAAQAGGLPVVLPHEVDCIGEYVARCDAIVLTGGDDPDTTAFGEPVHPQAKLIDPRRQAFELALLGAVDQVDLPVLGICLGMQMMALHRGGRLHQHLPDVLPPDMAQLHREGEHLVRCMVADHPVLPAEGLVHSHHHQSVAESGSMRACGLAEDGVIEAIDLPDRRFYLGVQWHPERTAGAFGDQLWQQLVSAVMVR